MKPRCKRCGKNLQKQWSTEGPDRKLLGFGYSATGMFCSLTCGHWFAVYQLRDEENAEYVVTADGVIVPRSKHV